MIELLLAAERMLRDGDLDHAERLFSQVAEADPRNAIAVVGLAEVAATRGDDGASIAAARRALEIDPDNPAARRMLERIQVAAPVAPPEPTPTPVAAPESTPTPVAAEPTRAPVAAAEPTRAPDTAPRRRSWLERLRGFLRRG
ncbi:MAG: tetratricopeptide repeat protein [Chloroflexota bacterium]